MATQATSEPTRRDFLYVATAAVGAVGAAAVAWPVINQMNPDASVLALASIEVDLSSVALGEEVTVKWRGMPVFIRYRTPEDVAEMQAVPVEALKDPEPDAARVKEGHEQWLIMVGICTHLGCVPTFNGGEFADGWFCPCHGSQYDASGRIRSGPAPKNLAIPPYQFVSDLRIQIG